MNKPEIIDDELWDHYSGLPNPMWYQHIEDLDDMVNNPSKYDKINVENIQNHIRIREEQYQMNALINWVLN